jgi:hypothetical protein
VKQEFILASECDSIDDDFDYINGSIALRIGSTQLLSKENYDLVDQLWSYLVYGALDLSQKKNTRIIYPDSSSSIEFESISGTEKAIIRTNEDGGKHAIVNRALFVNVLAISASQFFKELFRLIPTKEKKRYLDTISTIENLLLLDAKAQR